VQGWEEKGDRAGVPTTRVARGALKLDVHAMGELRAGRSVSLVTPQSTTSLRIVRLAGAGSAVKTGDVIVEFDPSEQQYALEQERSELLEAEQGIVKMKADAAVQAAADKVALLTARYDVRRAELDSLANDLIGHVEAKKRELTLEEAKRRLVQLEEDVKSRAATSQASLAVVLEKRNKARLAMERATATIDSLVIRAPIDGLVVIKENRDAAGGFFFGQTLPEYRAGDTASPGRPIADVLEAGEMQIRARVNENDRANLSVGQRASIRVDALPGQTFAGRIASLGALASRASFFDSSQGGRQFDAFFQIDGRDARLRPGSSVRIVVAGKPVDNALQVPRQAVFVKKGKTVVYVRAGDRFEPREVKVAHRTESRVAIDGVDEGVEVALIDPEATPGPAQRAPQPGPVRAGGGAR
jgi:multidrug resistance efflux pump